MKLNFIILSSILLIGVLFINAGLANQKPKINTEVSDFAIPEDIQKVIDNSCFGCHNTNSKNEKGKKKLSYDTLDTLETAKLVGMLAEIAEEVEENEMPPAKFLEFKPEAKLTDVQKKALIEWAESKAESLLE